MIKFRTWWSAPNTRKDRIAAAIVGAIGGFWIDLLPTTFSEVGYWALGATMIFSLLGVIFSKRHFMSLLSLFGIRNRQLTQNFVPP